MLDKYSKIQNLIDLQKQKKNKIVEIFENLFVVALKFEKIPVIEIVFAHKNDNHITIKIKDKSSVKFVVLKYSDNIKNEFQKIYPQEVMIIS